MKRLLAYLLVFFACTVCVLAQPTDSLNVASDDSSEAADSVVAATTPYVRASLVFIERDLSQIKTYFGHISLHLECPDAGLDYVFSYETPEEIGWLENLLGYGGVALVPVEIGEYLSMQSDRNITEYELNLLPAEKQRLWQLADRYIKKDFYLKNDYVNNGCATETGSLVRAAINGTIDYGNAFDGLGTTQAEVLIRNTVPSGLFRLFVLACLSTSLDETLPAEQLLFVPRDMVAVWSQATIVGNDGTHRKLMSSEGRVLNAVAPSLDRSHSEAPLLNTDILFVALIILVVSLTVADWQRRRLPIFRTIDRVLFAIYSLVAVLMLAVNIASNIVPSQFVCRTWAVINVVPLVVWAWSRIRPQSNARWVWIYAVYTLFIIVYIVQIFLRPEADKVEWAIATTLLIRMAGKLRVALVKEKNKNH